MQHMHKLNNAARQFECGPPSGFTCGLAVNAVERREAEGSLGGRATERACCLLSTQADIISTQAHTHTARQAGSGTCRRMHKTCLGTVAAN